jgi:hypothetical protein
LTDNVDEGKESHLLVLAVREIRLFFVEPVKLPGLLGHHLIELLDETAHHTNEAAERATSTNPRVSITLAKKTH